MADAVLVRVEIGFLGGDVLAMRVPVEDADALDAVLKTRDDAVCELRGEDGRFLVVLCQVFYVRRSAREARVGCTQYESPWASKWGSWACPGRGRRRCSTR